MSVDVCLTGTFARLALAEIADGTVGATYLKARSFSTYAGNDAAIASIHLAQNGVTPQLLLLSPSREDLSMIGEVMPSAVQITPVAARDVAGVTQSFCAMAQDGSRLWIVQGVDYSQLAIPFSDAKLLYVDLYDETEELLLSWLSRQGPRQTQRLVVNLSSSRLRDKAKALTGLSVSLLQGSARNSGVRSDEELGQLAHDLRVSSGAQLAVITNGAAGAYFASTIDCGRISSARVIAAGSVGAGAVFSAELLSALLSGLSGRELTERACERTAEALSKPLAWRLT